MTKMIQTFKSSALNVLLRDVHSNYDRSQNEKLISRERERGRKMIMTPKQSVDRNRHLLVIY